MRSGITNNYLHVYSNIDKVGGLLDILKDDIKRYPPNSDVHNVVPIFHFMAFIKLHTSSKDATMLLFDPEKNESTALEFYENIVAEEDDTPEFRAHFMNVFYQVCEHRDVCVDMAELALGDGSDDTGMFTHYSGN